MTAQHLLDTLVAQSLWLSLLLALCMLLHRVLLRRFGACAALAAWWLLPLGLLATWLPAVRVSADLALVRWLQSPVVVPPAVVPHGAVPSSWPVVAIGLLLVWMAGVLASLAVAWHAQLRFLSSLTKDDGAGLWRSPAGSSPAEAGLWRSRLVLPTDFEQRFSPAEQVLVMAHEAWHHQRHDNAWRLLSLLLCAVHWFNPLAWWAARCLRQHQELACDAAVLRHQPQALAAYAAALLKSHPPASRVPPASSTWQSPHPLIERFHMLERHAPLAPRRRQGQWLAATFAVLSAGAVYATQLEAIPPAVKTASVMLTLNLANDGLPGGSPQVLTPLGQPATVRVSPKDGTPGATWEIQLVTTQLADGRLQVESRYRIGVPSKEVARHTDVVASDQSFHFIVGSGDHVLSGNQTPRLLAAR